MGWMFDFNHFDKGVSSSRDHQDLNNGVLLQSLWKSGFRKDVLVISKLWL